MLSFIKKYWTFIFLFAFILTTTLLLIFISPEEIVSYIGVQNTYLICFLLAVFGGLSAVTGTSFFISVAAFSSGGADPFLLGILGGLGIFISDSIFFFAARHGIRLFKRKTKPLSLWLASKMDKHSSGAILSGVYLYIGFAPLPNDLLMIALALYGIPFKRLAPVLMAGSITVVMIAAYFGKMIF